MKTLNLKTIKGTYKKLKQFEVPLGTAPTAVQHFYKEVFNKKHKLTKEQCNAMAKAHSEACNLTAWHTKMSAEVEQYRKIK